MCRQLSLILLLPCLSVHAEEVDEEFFESRIRPVLIRHCYECHSADADDLSGGLLLDSRDAARRGGDSGPAVVPGSPDESLLLKAIAPEHRDLQMPPDSPLAKAVVDDFRKWISSGAPDPRDQPPSLLDARQLDLDGRRAGHWAWHAPRRPSGHAGIDELVHRRLNERGLDPSPTADPRVLVRRMFFDLVGLPPNEVEIGSFLADWQHGSHRAITRLADQLLQDPRFGEHWARHWLDLVRYCETKGHVTDQERPFAWKYRDYIIDAFNDDLPYDRFVTEHLAGDLLPESEARNGRGGAVNVAATATGALYMHEMHFMAVDPVKQRWDEIDAQIDVVSKAFLGLTVACARCHDHKFDAISQRDYYALAGFFYSTEQGQARTAARRELCGEMAGKVRILEADLQEFLSGKRKERVAAQKPKAAGVYFPVSDELGIQSPGETRKLLSQIDLLSQADPSWAYWVRAAQDVRGQDVALRVRGEHRNTGDVVQRGFLAAVAGDTVAPKHQLGEGSGRQWLAARIASADNPLTARVWVNRLWHHLFGRGIVATPNNLGSLGANPTHPELLDYLACQLMDQGWSTKALIREIVLSNTYAQSSDLRADSQAIDSQNLWLSRQNRRRLTAEQLRDAMLVVAGSIDPAMHGPSVECHVPPYATANKPSNVPSAGPVDGRNRRSIYLKVRRNFYDPFLLTFDFPDRGKSVGRRAVTIVPSQALAMLNSPLVHELAADWGDRLNSRTDDPQQRLESAWVAALGRPPTGPEIIAVRPLLESDAAGSVDAIWKDVAHIVFNHPDFAWID